MRFDTEESGGWRVTSHSTRRIRESAVQHNCHTTSPSFLPFPKKPTITHLWRDGTKFSARPIGRRPRLPVGTNHDDLLRGKDRGGVAIRLLASDLDEPDIIPDGVAPGFSHVGILPYEAADRWVFSGISRSPSPLHSGAAPYLARFILIGSQDLNVESHPNHSTLPAKTQELPKITVRFTYLNSNSANTPESRGILGTSKNFRPRTKLPPVATARKRVEPTQGHAHIVVVYPLERDHFHLNCVVRHEDVASLIELLRPPAPADEEDASRPLSPPPPPEPTREADSQPVVTTLLLVMFISAATLGVEEDVFCIAARVDSAELSGRLIFCRRSHRVSKAAQTAGKMTPAHWAQQVVTLFCTTITLSGCLLPHLSGGRAENTARRAGSVGVPTPRFGRLLTSRSREPTSHTHRMEQRRNAMAVGNGRSPRKPANQHDSQVSARCLSGADRITSNQDVFGGQVVDYWWRVEFQCRGSPHLHTVVWVKDHPNFRHSNDRPRWLERSPHNKANRFRIPAGSLLGFRKWEPCRPMPLVGRVFSGVYLFPPALAFRRRSIPTSLHPHRLFKSSMLRAAQTSAVTLENNIAAIEGARVNTKRTSSFTLPLAPSPRRGRQDFITEILKRRVADIMTARQFSVLHIEATRRAMSVLASPLANPVHINEMRNAKMNSSINVIGVGVEWRDLRRNARAGETGDPRENPPTNAIVRHDSHIRKSGCDPAGNRAGLSDPYITAAPLSWSRYVLTDSDSTVLVGSAGLVLEIFQVQGDSILASPLPSLSEALGRKIGGTSWQRSRHLPACQSSAAAHSSDGGGGRSSRLTQPPVSTSGSDALASSRPHHAAEALPSRVGVEARTSAAKHSEEETPRSDIAERRSRRNWRRPAPTCAHVHLRPNPPPLSPLLDRTTPPQSTLSHPTVSETCVPLTTTAPNSYWCHPNLAIRFTLTSHPTCTCPLSPIDYYACVVLKRILNSTRLCPDRLKRAMVTPLFKKGDKTERFPLLLKDRTVIGNPLRLCPALGMLRTLARPYAWYLRPRVSETYGRVASDVHVNQVGALDLVNAFMN
ncbi:hypothetical protein PR048_028909 [Dryococelus australis]|uniref:Uncharacterized protein n=1 Tax=Dryococelus australis TaxID=614101 RepID=A0ABQ9GBW1_9NEOP|nr:hypothetical protein PR048_028909 [Dryococelus australis]